MYHGINIFVSVLAFVSILLYLRAREVSMRKTAIINEEAVRALEYEETTEVLLAASEQLINDILRSANQTMKGYLLDNTKLLSKVGIAEAALIERDIEYSALVEVHNQLLSVHALLWKQSTELFEQYAPDMLVTVQHLEFVAPAEDTEVVENPMVVPS